MSVCSVSSIACACGFVRQSERRHERAIDSAWMRMRCDSTPTDVRDHVRDAVERVQSDHVHVNVANRERTATSDALTHPSLGRTA